MGLLNNIKDAFNKAEFTVAPNKKLKTISAEFKKAFDLTLVFYKGVTIADPELTLNQLGKKTTKEVNTTADGIKIKGSTKVGEAEKQFDKAFGVTVQIKDKSGKILVPNEITIGQAARVEETLFGNFDETQRIFFADADRICPTSISDISI